MKCSKISGSDEVDNNGRRIWNLTYEGTDAPTSSGEDALPQTKYSFSIEDANSGSMQVVNEGASPALTISVGSAFDIPGIGNVKCTKISGSDEYTDKGIRRWTVTYEGSNAEGTSSADIDNVKYSFSVEDGVISGSKQVIQYGNTPVFVHSIGQTFIIPGVGTVPCTKIDGSDEITDDGRHKWTISYQSSPETSTSSSDDALPQTKYNLAIEKDSDGVLQKSGSMSVASTGETPSISVAVGEGFNIPGLGNVICTKVSGNDSYSESGGRIWTMTYEGTIQSGSQGEDDDPADNNVRYSYTIEQDDDGEITSSGHIEISVIGTEPPKNYNIGDSFLIPGVGTLKCTRISGSDSYTDNGNRKWTVVFEGVEAKEDETSEDSGTVRYSHSTERDSNGVLSTTVSKQYSVTAENLAAVPNVGDSFSIPNLAGTFTCTKVTKDNDSSNLWTVTLEGASSEAGGGDDDGTSNLPENEISTSQEINGLTARSVSGEFIVLRRSETPITRKNITLYTETEKTIFSVGSEYEGGIITSISTSKETVNYPSLKKRGLPNSSRGHSTRIG